MADGAVFANIQGKSHIGVQRAALLDIAARADADALVVAAQRRREPNPQSSPSATSPITLASGAIQCRSAGGNWAALPSNE